MDKNEAFLIIHINYENNKAEIKLSELPSIKVLKKLAAKEFNIPKNKTNFLSFRYIDEEGDFNLLNENDNLIVFSKEVSNNLYILDLNLELDESRDNQRKSESNDNENVNDIKYEQIKNKNMKLKKEIEEIKKIKELEKEINEIKIKKEKKKLRKEKELMEIKMKNKEKIENLKNIKNSLILKKYINDLEKNLLDNIIPTIENKIKNIQEINNKHILNTINKEMNNILNELINKIEIKKNEIIKYQANEISNIISDNNKDYFKKINNLFKEINLKIKTKENDKEIKKNDNNNDGINKSKNKLENKDNNASYNLETQTNKNTGEVRVRINTTKNMNNNKNISNEKIIKLREQLYNLLEKILVNELKISNINEEQLNYLIDLKNNFEKLGTSFTSEMDKIYKSICTNYIPTDKKKEELKIKYKKIKNLSANEN